MNWIADAMAQAVHYQQTGQPAQAEQLYHQILEADPANAEAVRRLGTIYQAQGRLAEAVMSYQRALWLNPDYGQACTDLGIAYAMQGQLAEAAEQFQKARELLPESADPPNNLGILCAMQGRPAEAIDQFQEALRLHPDYAEAHNNLANALRDQGHKDEAVASYRQALRLNPQYAEAHNNLGAVLKEQGQLAEAVASFQQALQLRPSYLKAHHNLGAALAEQGRHTEAEASYRQAVRLNPNYPEVYVNLGIVLKDQGRFAEAVASFQEALRLRPDFPEAHNSLGNALLEQGRHDEAVSSFRQALQLRADFAEAHNNLGNAFADQGRLAEALASYRQAIRSKPAYSIAHSNLLLHLNYLPQADPDEVFAEHRRWEEAHGQGNKARPPYPNSRDPERRLRIGYVTPDLNRHPVARFFVEPILAQHDPRHVETICYAEVPTAMTAQVQSLAHGWRAIRGVSDAQLADQVRTDGIDILVDLAGHTVNNRLRAFAYKPAPVQITYLGYPNTTGLTTIDYRLTDAVADPPGEPARYTEELVRLPGGFCCYAPLPEAPPVSSAPVRAAGHITFGSPHHLAKLNADVIDLWCTLLKRLPSARLLIFRHTLKGRTRDNLERQFVERGIAADRLDLRPAVDMSQGYLGFYGLVDITLDAFPWSGHTTACDSLWMGVPFITLAGNNHAGRMAASVLDQVGLAEWVAQTPEQYLELAARMAGDPEKLSELRLSLRDRLQHSPLCDGPAFTRRLEETYQALWRRWCSAPVS